MYIVEVKTPGKVLTFKNREVRTPADFEVEDREIKTFKVMLRQEGVSDYNIRSKEEVNKENKVIKNTLLELPEFNREEDTVIVEEIMMDDEEETKSVLDELIKDAEKE